MWVAVRWVGEGEPRWWGVEWQGDMGVKVSGEEWESIRLKGGGWRGVEWQREEGGGNGWLGVGLLAMGRRVRRGMAGQWGDEGSFGNSCKRSGKSKGEDGDEMKGEKEKNEG